MTDAQLILRLAQYAMGWPVYDSAHHRPGQRPVPYAWRWRRGRNDHLMISTLVDDGRGGQRWRNDEWNPLGSSAAAAAVAEAMAARGTPLPPALVAGDATKTPDGRRALCEAAHQILISEYL